MPPNLGGFFMVRSYYPSECHADYFDFERIEALKPAIEACGISTLFQSPMLRSEERFSRNAETDVVCRVLLEKKRLDAGRAALRGAGCTAHAGRQARTRGFLWARRFRPRGIGSGPFFFNDTATTEIYTLSLHDALPICHADYFDFERIEALKPAIEACGISTLSQSPMLGFHKQMDNRIKLLEEILSFRMQGVEFDNGDMYVDGHKAASDVR